MLDIKALLKQYSLYAAAKTNYIDLKKACTKYHKKHEDDLIPQKMEFESEFFSKEKAKKYLSKNDELRRFFHIKFLKDYYEEKENRYLNDLSNVPKNERYVIIKTPLTIEELKKDDIENINVLAKYYKGSFINLSNMQSTKFKALKESEITFIIKLLEHASSFICEISEEDISLIMNIFNDIKNKNPNESFSNNEIYNEYKKTIHKLKFTNDEMLLVNLRKIVAKAKEDLSNGLITYEEYRKVRYMYLIVTSEDLDALYNSLDKNEQKHLLSAYKKLSSYEYFKKYQVYYRSPSKIINDEVYLSREKKK